ncbi:hypothetical protein DITRI_Ditri06bG0132500 [Diplodiscus trichospermus]
MKDQGQSRKTKREDMKTPKLEMKKGAGKRSSSRKKGRKNFPFSSSEIGSPGGRPKVVGKKLQRRQCKLQVELMETELAKMKGEIRDWNESLLAAEIEASKAEAELELMIATRNELMDNLMEMKATEDFLMHNMGIL